MELGQQIKNKLKLDGIKVPELAILLEIPADRIYKWQQGHKPHDAKDYIKITKWLESVPHGTKNGNRQDHNESMIHPYTLSDKRLKSAEPEKNQPVAEKLVETVKNLSEAILRLMNENADLKASKIENS